MAAMAPPPPPSSSAGGSSSEDDDDSTTVTSSLDTNGDGKVSLEELLAASGGTSSASGETEEANVFSSIRSQFLEMIDSYQVSAGISSANLQQQLMSDISI
jgi:hypothetical protein